MTNLLRKPLFWTNLAAFIVTGLVVAGLAFGWTNPGVTPPGGSGAITVDASGNVGVGTVNPLAKLHVAGDLLVNVGSGITLGGLKRTSWPLGGSRVVCSANFCTTTGTDKIYLSQMQGSSNPPYINIYSTTVNMPGVQPNSNVACGGAYCEILATDKIYLTQNRTISTAPYVAAFVAVLNTPGVRTYSEINCGAGCNITTPDLVYVTSPHSISAAPYVEAWITTLSAPGVTISE